MAKLAAFASKPETRLAVAIGLIALGAANVAFGNRWVAAGLFGLAIAL
jgi:hypothetical protein